MTLTEQEQQQINTLVRRFETQTGIEAVAAVVGRCDAYPEIPWKAYALGSSLGALAVLVYPGAFADWGVESSLAFDAMAVLGCGAALALLAAFIPPLGRFFLERTRAEAEVRQYALGIFLERQLFRTRERRAALLLVSRYERAAVVLPDAGVTHHAPAEGIEHVTRAMQAALASDGLTRAFEVGFDELRTLVQRHGFVAAPPSGNELDDAIVTEKGA